MIDNDLSEMNEFQLYKEVKKLRSAIREHRNEKGHERCHLSNKKLYSVLPESEPYDDKLPPWAEFVEQCEIFWKENQLIGKVHDGTGPHDDNADNGGICGKVC